MIKVSTMNTRFTLSFIATMFCFAETTFAESNLEDRIKKLEEIILIQQEQIKALQNQKQQPTCNPVIVKTTLNDLEERVDAIETRSYTDKIEFGLGFKNRVDNFTQTMGDGKKYSDNNIWSMKLNLNMKSKIDEYMKFSGRLTMYKYWADSTKHEFTQFDSMQGRAPSDSGLYVERAYLDWKISDNEIPVILTIGRQPSADGPSYQFSDDTARKSTYSALAFDGASDGIVVTTDLSKITKIENTGLRFAYGKGYQDDTYGASQNAYVGVNNNQLKDNDVYGIFFDSSIPNLEDSSYQIGYALASDVVADSRKSQTTNKNLGDISLLGAMIEVPKIAKSNFDLFAHIAHSKAKANGNKYDSNNDNIEDTGLLSDDGKGTHNGYAYWTGLRYNKESWQYGFEYNYGSKNWISISQGARDSYNKLSTRGNAYEIYVNKSINKYSNLRVGFVDINYKYSGSGWHTGEPTQIDSNTIKSLTDLYFQLQVLF